MISEIIKKNINKQINAELWSAYLYLAMSLDADDKNYPGIAHWFYIQWLEEQDHARIFQKYLCDQNVKVELQAIDDVQQEWDGPLDMFRDTLRHEEEVTELINDLVRLSWREGDFATLSRLQFFVDEQVEEEHTAAEIMKLLADADEDFVALRDIDRRLAKREYHQAAPLQ